MNDSTGSSLGVFWDGEEVDGFSVYGYWPERNEVAPKFPEELWEGATSNATRLGDLTWTVWIWDIRIGKWPEAMSWAARIERTLRRMIEAGALVSWCGLEGLFVDPPDLFSPEHMHGGVWCALTANGRLFPPPGLDDSFKRLDDKELLQLREAAGL
jgi:hypothetical protein